MVAAADARDWAKEKLRGIADSLYTPYNGKWGEEIDYEAIRHLVGYCLGDLDHDGLMITGGVGEFWALTTEERKRVVEVQVEEARKVKPESILFVVATCSSAKDTLELTRHAQDTGADMVMIQNPFMEAHGGPGTLDFFNYVAEQTDIALGMFNSPCSGFVMTPAECALIAKEIPAVCAIKDPGPPGHHGLAVKKLAPEIITWSCDTTHYHAGLVQQGLESPMLLGDSSYLQETPTDRRRTEWFNLVLEGKLEEARLYYYSAGVEAPTAHGLNYTNSHPDRPGYFTHWGSVTKHAASLLGLPVGDYPHSRPPQTKLGVAEKARIKEAYVNSGLIAS